MNTTYWVILGLLLGAEYFAATQYESSLAFVELLQFIAIPIYIFLVSTVFFTEDKVLTFELVLFRKWSTVARGRLLSLLLSILPFMIFTVFLAGHYNRNDLIAPISVAILFYSSAVLISTTIGGGSRLYVLSMGLLFMLPFSSLVLIQNQANIGNPVQGFMGYLTYLFAPIYGSYAVSSGILLVNVDKANLGILLFSFLLGLGYLYIFERREVYP
ncbi:hypothetical protein X802_09215 [Thermococcus guaymasensis DSM 11113]|uniref:Uncharacterized protein n=2 Tax=Thermococcus guaymasensis TaxID=110164 RepID=A0A0X1KNH9_9EURY|nr:hypothetical protein X802_09215 [Thermococcus guaymasensis DSM 11113]